MKRTREDEDLEEVADRFKDKPCRFLDIFKKGTNNYYIDEPLGHFLQQRSIDNKAGCMTKRECDMAKKALDVLEDKLKAEMEVNNAVRVKGQIREAQKRNKDIKEKLLTVRYTRTKYYNGGITP